MGVQRFCDHCNMMKLRTDGSSSVRRYTLRREVDQARDKGVRTNRFQMSAGGIDLCDDCWGAICKPRMNPKKAHPPRNKF